MFIHNIVNAFMLRRIIIFICLLKIKTFLNIVSFNFFQLSEFFISITKLFIVIIVSYGVYPRARIINKIFLVVFNFFIILAEVIEFIFFKIYIFWYLGKINVLILLYFHWINYIVWRSRPSVYLLFLICKQIIFWEMNLFSNRNFTIINFIGLGI